MTAYAQRVLITGAYGFVGRWLSAAIRQAHPHFAIHACVASGPLPEAEPGVSPLILDVTDRRALMEAVQRIAPTAVVHLAAIAAPAEAKADPDEAWRVNFDGTRNLAVAVLRHAPQARFINVGSSEAYGGSFVRASAPLTEEAVLDPMTPYAATKAAADTALGQLAHQGLQLIRFRPFNHTGPGQSEAYVAPAFARQIARIERGLQEPTIKVGNLDAERSFLDVRDVVRAYVLGLTLPFIREPGLILNIASARTWRISDVLQLLLNAARCQITVDVDPARQRLTDVPLAAGDAGKADRILGWRPEIPFENTLADLLDDWRARMHEAGV